MQTIQKTIKLLKCDRCGNTWQPRIQQPVKCPKCGHRFDSKRINQKHKVGEARPSQSIGNPNPSKPTHTGGKAKQ